MARRNQQIRAASGGSTTDLPTARPFADLPHPGGLSLDPAGAALTACKPTATETAPDAAASEAQAKRRAFIQALARQAARELAAEALTARDD